ncbi:MAG: VOC family protein [Vicinamibacterales bacterium]
MTEFASHQPGTMSWVELATTDQQAGVAFYRALFDWDVSEQPIGPTEVYSMFQLRGQDVGAAYSMRDDERKMGVPPHWNLYVTVANAEDSARQAQELGGTLLAPPFDVMDAGRMAVVQDPSGAIIQLWEAKRSIGAKILGEPGALCWSELTTRDPDAARAFYTALLGWTARESGGDSPMPYTEFSNQGQPGMGMMKMPDHMPAEVPSYWMPYFQVADCDAATAKAAGLGATIVVPAQDIPKTGRFSILSDPQGAIFAVFTFVS